MNTYNLVKQILEEKVACRNSDKHLIWTFMTYKSGKSGSPVISLVDFLNCIPFESITRARRAVQQHHPELQATEPVRKGRAKKASNPNGWLY